MRTSVPMRYILTNSTQFRPRPEYAPNLKRLQRVGFPWLMLSGILIHSVVTCRSLILSSLAPELQLSRTKCLCHSQNELSRLFAADARFASLSPIIAALTKYEDFKSFICRTYKQDGGGSTASQNGNATAADGWFCLKLPSGAPRPESPSRSHWSRAKSKHRALRHPPGRLEDRSENRCRAPESGQRSWSSLGVHAAVVL